MLQVKGEKLPTPVRGVKVEEDGGAEAEDDDEEGGDGDGEGGINVADLVPRNDIRYCEIDILLNLVVLILNMILTMYPFFYKTILTLSFVLCLQRKDHRVYHHRPGRQKLESAKRGASESGRNTKRGQIYHPQHRAVARRSEAETGRFQQTFGRHR